MEAEAGGKIRPTLYAYLLCEQVLMEKDEVTSLIRILDIFTLTIPLEPRGAYPLRFVLYTRWGNGLGRFIERLELKYPDGKTVKLGSQDFNLDKQFHFYQIRHNILLGAEKPGLYRFLLYLDGEFVGELPFEVRFETQPRKGPEPVQPGGQ